MGWKASRSKLWGVIISVKASLTGPPLPPPLQATYASAFAGAFILGAGGRVNGNLSLE